MQLVRIFRLQALLAAMLLAALAPNHALAAMPPAPQGPIYDEAQLLPPDQEAQLDQRLREYNKRTGNAVIVATVNSLEGESIERYATRLFETWGIGGKERDAGVLLLVAPTERKVRIEVGYGLHPWITDILSGRIIRKEITPRFKAGDMPGGILAGVDAIIQQLDRSPTDAKAIAEAAAAEQAQRGSGDGVGIGGVIFWIMLIVFLTLMFGRRRRGYRRSGIDPGIILWGISEIAHHAARGDRGGGFGGGIDFGGGGFGGFGGGMSGGGGASGDW